MSENRDRLTALAERTRICYESVAHMTGEPEPQGEMALLLALIDYVLEMGEFLRAIAGNPRV